MPQTIRMHGYMKAYVSVSYVCIRVYMHLYVHDGVNVCAFVRWSILFSGEIYNRVYVYVCMFVCVCAN